jgi:hypothetical protein
MNGHPAAPVRATLADAAGWLLSIFWRERKANDGLRGVIRASSLAGLGNLGRRSVVA